MVDASLTRTRNVESSTHAPEYPSPSGCEKLKRASTYSRPPEVASAPNGYVASCGASPHFSA